MKKNLDSQRLALQSARDALQKGIDDYEETQGSMYIYLLLFRISTFDTDLAHVKLLLQERKTKALVAQGEAALDTYKKFLNSMKV